jgi:hypothetical protein
VAEAGSFEVRETWAEARTLISTIGMQVRARFIVLIWRGGWVDFLRPRGFGYLLYCMREN